ncbi:MAG: glycosyltransferase family 39 protein [Caldilineaceae bacterium]|nr:glycosyltransferase family 39 protein [Caldilineaceae bacterium]
MRKHIPLLLILLLSALLRFYALGASSLWSDEGNTWALTERSFAQIAVDAAADIHPPGYYWLLKLWTQLGGHSAVAMRSFSALAGCLLVWVIYQIGTRLSPALPKDGRLTWARHTPALLAAFLAALHPLQIYYSQEARMYMLLALEGALLFWALLALIEQEQQPPAYPPHGRRWLWPAVGFVLAGSAGLWTHYSFPILLGAAGATYLYYWVIYKAGQRRFKLLARYMLINLLIVASYLPWLPIATHRLLNWPKGGESTPIFTALAFTLRTLALGPLRNTTELTWPLLMGLLPLLGAYSLWRAAQRHPRKGLDIQFTALVLWLGGPILVMFGLGLFTEAFLKFLLAAAPAWCLLSAAAIMHFYDAPLLRTAWFAIATTAAVAVALVALPGYYTDPTARDNYAGAARYVQAVGDPQTDLIVLDAPGQQEVWRYYHVAIPTLALPQQRPADAQQTIDALTAAATDRHSIFALFWATDEADPQRLVESWLDQNAFKGIESWQGNMRFVNYTLGAELTCQSFDKPPTWHNQIQLRGWCHTARTSDQTSIGPVAAGQVALIQLQWQSPILQQHAYKVSLQLLNERNQIVAQRDSEPAGGLRPTTTWKPDETIIDNHGLAIPPGTPPGHYQLIAVLYDGETNTRERLGNALDNDDVLVLGQVEVSRMESAIPLAVIPMQHRYNAQLGPVQFVGYDAYKQGFRHAPEQHLEPGDILHVTLYWQAPSPLPQTWPANLEFVMRLGHEELRAPLASAAYATAQWQSGEFVRGEFDLLFDGLSRRPTIEIGNNSLRLEPLP